VGVFWALFLHQLFFSVENLCPETHLAHYYSCFFSYNYYYYDYDYYPDVGLDLPQLPLSRPSQQPPSTYLVTPFPLSCTTT